MRKRAKQMGYEGAQALEYQVTVTATEWNKNHMG